MRSYPLKQVGTVTLLHAEKDEGKKSGWNFKNPLQEISDIMSNLDDVIDDFMGKRMGNGEVFYGQRKFKPSGRENTEGKYNGMGLSDKLRIDVARERKEEYLEMKRARKQE